MCHVNQDQMYFWYSFSLRSFINCIWLTFMKSTRPADANHAVGVKDVVDEKVREEVRCARN